ncbi:hypothetical protein VNO78_21131 [Psophocarpus tetragonolobus]|uniref:Uncharacterized protein n=1 Tax=Psophocarpus tetragonolobus TaxID=3891 RepID=A0AAN9SB27_PSOTE
METMKKRYICTMNLTWLSVSILWSFDSKVITTSKEHNSSENDLSLRPSSNNQKSQVKPQKAQSEVIFFRKEIGGIPFCPRFNMCPRQIQRATLLAVKTGTSPNKRPQKDKQIIQHEHVSLEKKHRSHTRCDSSSSSAETIMNHVHTLISITTGSFV